jgi:hypothetical protein
MVSDLAEAQLAENQDRTAEVVVVRSKGLPQGHKELR